MAGSLALAGLRCFMNRKEAISLLARRDLGTLSLEKRESLLLDWWSIDPDDPQYASLPDPLRRMLAHSDQPDDPTSALYNPLLQLALEYSYIGVVNNYLSTQLALPGKEVTVEGDVGDMEVCPCCRYRSLETGASYDICGVCFWEDDGTTELHRHSGPNHQTLSDAQRNFRHLGAVTEASRQYVLADGKNRYALMIP